MKVSKFRDSRQGDSKCWLYLHLHFHAHLLFTALAQCLPPFFTSSSSIPTVLGISININHSDRDFVLWKNDSTAASNPDGLVEGLHLWLGLFEILQACAVLSLCSIFRLCLFYVALMWEFSLLRKGLLSPSMFSFVVWGWGIWGSYGLGSKLVSRDWVGNSCLQWNFFVVGSIQLRLQRCAVRRASDSLSKLFWCHQHRVQVIFIHVKRARLVRRFLIVNRSLHSIILHSKATPYRSLRKKYSFHISFPPPTLFSPSQAYKNWIG